MSLRNVYRKFDTLKNLIITYGLKGFFKAALNKIRGKNLLDGLRADDYQFGTLISLFDVSRYIAQKPRNYPVQDYSCTVVVPVFNGLEHLKKLVPSILKYTPAGIKVLFVDDCSTDTQIVPYLNAFLETNDNWNLLVNDKNSGFTRTVNKAMAMVDTDYAVLLNTDTEVVHNWIPKLLTPFFENNKIATTTPFTNSGEFFSFPRYTVDNTIEKSIEEYNQAFDYIVSNEYALNEIHSGMGFCIGINMRCWEEIGDLDEINYDRGYGEESEWCFRASKKGWRHLLVPNLFICHYHGGSFTKAEKRYLCEQHTKNLVDQYPDNIDKYVREFIVKNPWKLYRAAAAIKLSGRNSLIYVDLLAESSDVSGAIDYATNDLEQLKSSGFDIIVAHYARGTKEWSIVPFSVDPTLEIMLDDVSDLWLLFDLLDVKKLIVNNLAFCENVEKALKIFTRLKERYEFELEYKFHDYLSICPSFFLINCEKHPCTPMCLEYCKDCIRKSNTKAVQRDYIVQWRAAFDEFFFVVDRCIFFSNYTKDIVCRVYPQVSSKNIVKYHEPLFKDNITPYVKPEYNGKWNIGFVGNFCMEKGSEYFLAMKELLESQGIDAEFKIIGNNFSRDDITGIKVTGRYQREELGSLLSDNEIHFVLYTSINNETFSYVAQELMLLNVPFVVLPCGAPQERILNSNYELAKVAGAVSVESLYEATDELVKCVYNTALSGEET